MKVWGGICIYWHYIYTLLFFRSQITTKQLLNNECLLYQGISVAKNNGELDKSQNQQCVHFAAGRYLSLGRTLHIQLLFDSVKIG